MSRASYCQDGPEILDSVDSPVSASGIAEATRTYFHFPAFPKLYKTHVGSGLTFQTASYKVIKLGQITRMRRELLREYGFGLDSVTVLVGKASGHVL